ncbi:GntR family transcriptional regulator [Solwaraspora sp. WMMA2101]|uniref:GntR family transcriptional regulator n=1 Tax=Solwaraspora sp. WMMA2101 TaxID=3404124 RepID=UPI003B943596
MAEAGETAETVAAHLREEIRTGELAEGDRVPTANAVMDRFGVGRGAAQQALNALRAEGLVTSRRGAPGIVKGWFARLERVMPDRLDSSKQLGRTIHQHDAGDRPIRTDVEVDELPAPDFVAAAFGVDEGDPVVRRKRVHWVEGRRVQISASYFPVELARGTAIVYKNSGPGGVYGRLEDQGWKPTRFEERVVARPPHPDEIDDLDIARNRATVLQITRYARSGDRCVEVNRMVLDAGVYELVNHFDLTAHTD